jgi:hypothetical protein
MDKLRTKVTGEVTILRDGEVIFKEHNTITGDALELLLRSMTGVTSSDKINTIKVTGAFGTVSKTITAAVASVGTTSVTYTATAVEADFNGIVTDLALNMSSVNKNLATKTGLSINKDNLTRLEIQWKITLTLI